jgi:two-component system chemotaxis response regulator CheY
MDGIEFIRCIRAQEEYKHIPILLFSTESTESKQRAKDAGATGMLEKPMAKENMLTHIRRLVR